MTTTENELSEIGFVYVKRHINLGDFHNAETKIQELCETSPEKQLETTRRLREALNTWELEERENFLTMQQLQREQEEIFREKERLERDTAAAKFRKELLEFIEANPGASLDDLVLTFERSRDAIEQHIYKLQNAGKIKRQMCKESFVLEDEDFEDEEEDM